MFRRFVVIFGAGRNRRGRPLTPPRSEAEARERLRKRGRAGLADKIEIDGEHVVRLSPGTLVEPPAPGPAIVPPVASRERTPVPAGPKRPPPDPHPHREPPKTAENAGAEARKDPRAVERPPTTAVSFPEGSRTGLPRPPMPVGHMTEPTDAPKPAPSERTLEPAAGPHQAPAATVSAPAEHPTFLHGRTDAPLDNKGAEQSHAPRPHELMHRLTSRPATPHAPKKAATDNADDGVVRSPGACRIEVRVGDRKIIAGGGADDGAVQGPGVSRLEGGNRKDTATDGTGGDVGLGTAVRPPGGGADGREGVVAGGVNGGVVRAVVVCRAGGGDGGCEGAAADSGVVREAGARWVGSVGVCSGFSGVVGEWREFGVCFGGVRGGPGVLFGGRVDRGNEGGVRGGVVRAAAWGAGVEEGLGGGERAGNILDGSGVRGIGHDGFWTDAQGTGRPRRPGTAAAAAAGKTSRHTGS